MILHLSLNLPEDQSYAGIARFLGRSLLDYLHVAERDIADLEYVIGELTENVVRHAHSLEQRFLVDLKYYAERVVLTVEDQGHGFFFKDVPLAGSARRDAGGEERVGGFGLQIVRSLADRLEFVRHDKQGTTIRAEMRLHYRTPADKTDAVGLDQGAGSEASGWAG